MKRYIRSTAAVAAMALAASAARADHADPRRVGRDRHRHRPRQRDVHEARERTRRRQGEGQLHPGRAARQRRAGDRADDARLGPRLRRRPRLVRELGEGLLGARMGFHFPRQRPHGEVSRVRPVRRDGRGAAHEAGAAHPRRRAHAAARAVRQEGGRLARRPEGREDAGARRSRPISCCGRPSAPSRRASPGPRYSSA